MGIIKLFRKIKLGFVRAKGNYIPYVPEQKRYGNFGEDELVYKIKSLLPSCQIKENVIINSLEGNAEIDCLIMYQNKLFAIEIKRWKGYIYEHDNIFLQRKVDKWTDEIHEKQQKSPFKQLGRAIHLLRSQIQNRAWINSIVFFEEADDVSIISDNVWFNNVYDLVRYVESDGRKSAYNEALETFTKARSADILLSKSSGRSLNCLILDESLHFESDFGSIEREDISKIDIQHHWSYDEVNITLTDLSKVKLNLENAKIKVIDNNYLYEYSLCKLDSIILGTTL